MEEKAGSEMTMCSATMRTSTESSRTKLVCVTDDVDRTTFTRTAEFKLIARPRSGHISSEPPLGDDCASGQRIITDRQLKNRNLNVEISDDFCGRADPSTTQPAFLDRMKIRFAQFKASVVPSNYLQQQPKPLFTGDGKVTAVQDGVNMQKSEDCVSEKVLSIV